MQTKSHYLTLYWSSTSLCYDSPISLETGLILCSKESPAPRHDAHTQLNNSSGFAFFSCPMQKKPYPLDFKWFFEADLQTAKAGAVDELLSAHGQINHHTHDYSWKDASFVFECPK